MAPLLAGQEDTDISSLLETAETRCSNKGDLSGKSEMEEKASVSREVALPPTYGHSRS